MYCWYWDDNNALPADDVNDGIVVWVSNGEDEDDDDAVVVVVVVVVVPRIGECVVMGRSCEIIGDKSVIAIVGVNNIKSVAVVAA